MNLLEKSSARGVWSYIPRVPLLLSKYTYISSQLDPEQSYQGKHRAHEPRGWLPTGMNGYGIVPSLCRDVCFAASSRIVTPDRNSQYSSRHTERVQLHGKLLGSEKSSFDNPRLSQERSKKF
jgi:hypothetical protein